MYLVFDIGGTKTRIAVSTNCTTLDAIEHIETPLVYKEGLSAIQKVATRLIGQKSLICAVGGIRGPLNHEKTGIISEVVLTDWVGRNIVGDLSKVLSAPVYLENDTALVGLGEITFGAGQGCDIVAYHTVSTGVGGARFVHGVLDSASGGFEPGHQILDIDRTILGRKEVPTLENLVSGKALEKRKGTKPYLVLQEDGVWDELAQYLAHGLRNTVVYWSPDKIVLGGSMIVGDPNIPLDRIIFHTKKILEGLMPCPPIVKAELKDDGGLFGALAYISTLKK